MIGGSLVRCFLACSSSWLLLPIRVILFFIETLVVRPPFLRRMIREWLEVPWLSVAPVVSKGTLFHYDIMDSSKRIMSVLVPEDAPQYVVLLAGVQFDAEVLREMASKDSTYIYRMSMELLRMDSLSRVDYEKGQINFWREYPTDERFVRNTLFEGLAALQKQMELVRLIQAETGQRLGIVARGEQIVPQSAWVPTGRN